MSDTTLDVDQMGKYPIKIISVESHGGGAAAEGSSQNLPPKPLLVVTPTTSGEFHLLVLIHGYLLLNSYYSQLMQHVASHGFIIVAPQLYKIAGSDCEPDIKSTEDVLNWLPSGLPSILPEGIMANLTNIALSGHSRGGKVAFAVALDHSFTTSSTISALIAIDPVDGTGSGTQTNPPVLTYVPLSFDLGMPAMVVGTGYGELRRNPLFPPCAPEGLNHSEFFDECRAPACHLVAACYGHLDMLDDETKGLRGRATYCLCKSGNSREPMRRFVAGAMVAFMEAYLEGDKKDLVQVIEKPETAPVDLSVATFRSSDGERRKES